MRVGIERSTSLLHYPSNNDVFCCFSGSTEQNYTSNLCNSLRQKTIISSAEDDDVDDDYEFDYYLVTDCGSYSIRNPYSFGHSQ